MVLQPLRAPAYQHLPLCRVVKETGDHHVEQVVGEGVGPRWVGVALPAYHLEQKLQSKPLRMKIQISSISNLN